MQKTFVAILACLAIAGCASIAPAPKSADGAWAPGQAMTKELQAQFTADKAIQVLKDGNARFTSGSMTQRDLRKQVKTTGYGQYPFASIVSCIDSRSAPEAIFDLGVGDAFVARVAGNVVNNDILGSLEFASKLAGSRLVVVLGHSSCGAIKGACDDAKMGNLTELLAKMKPAVQSVAYTGERSSKNDQFVHMVAEMNVQQTVEAIRSRSAVLREMEQKGEIKIVGAMLDVKTGQVTWY